MFYVRAFEFCAHGFQGNSSHTAAAVSLFVLNFWNVFCHVSSQWWEVCWWSCWRKGGKVMKSGIVCVGRRALGERNEPRTHAPPPASDATSILQVNTLLSILRVCILVRSSGREILGVPYFPGISRYRGTKFKAWYWDGMGLGFDLRYCRYLQPWKLDDFNLYFGLTLSSVSKNLNF